MVSSWDQKPDRSGHFSVLDAKPAQDRVQEAFKTAQDGPKTTPRRAKTGQDALKTGQDTPRTLPRHLQNGLKTTQDPPRRPKTAQDAPKTPSDLPRSGFGQKKQ